MSLKSVLEKLNNISSTTKRLEKEEYIKEYKDDELFIKVVRLAEDPMKLYKTKTIPFIKNSKTANLNKAFEFLETMSSNTGTSNEDRQKLGELCSIDEETHEIFVRIVKKDLRCDVGISTWKKYINDLEEHKVMLCKDDLGKFIEKAVSFDNIGWSLKKDGVRTWAIVNLDDTVTYLSRNGKIYSNFGKFDKILVDATKEISKEYDIEYPIRFDGEMDSNRGVRDFDNIISNARSKSDVDDSAFQYAIFDLVDENYLQKERYDILKTQFEEDDKTKDVYLLKHYFGTLTSEKDIMDLLDKVLADGEEGLVLKMADAKYEFKKSISWCKVKKFETLDLNVVDIEIGKEKKFKGLVRKLIVDYNGVLVGVGSGISDADRKNFLTNTPQVIEVKYQEITKDKSLRFPVFIRVREDKY